MTRWDMWVATEKKVKESIKTIEKHFNVKMVTPKISFDLRGVCAGKACYKEHLIKINQGLMRDNYDDMLNQTVPHEVAHLAAKIIHRRRVKPHGHEWREVMYALGLDPKRCHSYDVTTAKVRTRKVHKLSCDCQTHDVSRTIIQRMRQGQTYTCRKCKSALRTC